MNEEMITSAPTKPEIIGKQMDDCIERRQKESALKQIIPAEEVIVIKVACSKEELDERFRAVMNFINNPKI